MKTCSANEATAFVCIYLKKNVYIVHRKFLNQIFNSLFVLVFEMNNTNARLYCTVFKLKSYILGIIIIISSLSYII